jgi:hypothetical protein
MKNDILFIGATHGNEPIGVNALRNLQKKRNDFDWIIGNERALAQNTREYEGDLNRSAPGDKSSDLYAQRRAAEIITTSENYRFTIDLHGAPATCGIFLLLTNLSEENLELASLFSIDRIVYWPSLTPELEGPLSENFPCGLEIECGPKDDPATQNELEELLMDFLDNRTDRMTESWEKRMQNKQLFEVVGVLNDASQLPILSDFQETTIYTDRFVPILTNTYQHLGIACYKMKRKSLDEWLTR